MQFKFHCQKDLFIILEVHSFKKPYNMKTMQNKTDGENGNFLWNTSHRHILTIDLGPNPIGHFRHMFLFKRVGNDNIPQTFNKRLIYSNFHREKYYIRVYTHAHVCVCQMREETYIR